MYRESVLKRPLVCGDIGLQSGCLIEGLSRGARSSKYLAFPLLPGTPLATLQLLHGAEACLFPCHESTRVFRMSSTKPLQGHQKHMHTNTSGAING
jgi:hypothetical protein